MSGYESWVFCRFCVAYLISPFERGGKCLPSLLAFSSIFLIVFVFSKPNNDGQKQSCTTGQEKPQQKNNIERISCLRRRCRNKGWFWRWWILRGRWYRSSYVIKICISVVSTDWTNSCVRRLIPVAVCIVLIRLHSCGHIGVRKSAFTILKKHYYGFVAMAAICPCAINHTEYKKRFVF